MADNEPLSADFTTLDDLRHDLLSLANALDNTTRPFAQAHGSVVSGAGQFAAELSAGASGFLLSWDVALRTMSDGSALVGNNIGKAAVDLRAVDAGFSTTVQL